MQRKLPTTLRIGGGLVLLTAVAVLVWWGLDRLESRPKWLRVEGPRRVVAGKPMSVRVHLAPLAEATSVCADLRGGARRDAPMYGLVCGAIRPVGKEGGTFDFEFMVPPRKGVRFATVVVYLTRTGHWGNRTLAANTEILPATTNTAEEVPAPQLLRLQPVGGTSNPNHYSTPLPRRLTGLLFLVAAVVAWRTGGRQEQRRQWQVLALLLALAGLYELFGLESWLAARARKFALSEDVYGLRVGLQRAVIGVIVAGSFPFLMLVRRAQGRLRLVIAVLGLYAAFAAVNLVSLHVIDTVAGLSWGGVSLGRALKVACTVTILWLAQPLAQQTRALAKNRSLE